jgi:fumarate reductase flavoprotein subunit
VAKEPVPTLVDQAADERRWLENELMHQEGKERLATLREEMQTAMEVSAGIYRDGKSLAPAADKLRELKDRCGRLNLQDTSNTFNTERVAALELGCMLDVAESIVASALAREESRGAHQRTDFPDRDDERFLAHSLAHRAADGSCRVEYAPVTITRWPPGERVYGRQ